MRNNNALSKIREVITDLQGRIDFDTGLVTKELEQVEALFELDASAHSALLDTLYLDNLALLRTALENAGRGDLVEMLPSGPWDSLATWEALVDIQSKLPPFLGNNVPRINVALEYLLRGIGTRRVVRANNTLTEQLHLLKHMWSEILPRVMREAEIKAETYRTAHGLQRQLAENCKALLTPTTLHLSERHLTPLPRRTHGGLEVTREESWVAVTRAGVTFTIPKSMLPFVVPEEKILERNIAEEEKAAKPKKAPTKAATKAPTKPKKRVR